jgi:hypothetical protein
MRGPLERIRSLEHFEPFAVPEQAAEGPVVTFNAAPYRSDAHHIRPGRGQTPTPGDPGDRSGYDFRPCPSPPQESACVQQNRERGRRAPFGRRSQRLPGGPGAGPEFQNIYWAVKTYAGLKIKGYEVHVALKNWRKAPRDVLFGSSSKPLLRGLAMWFGNMAGDPQGRPRYTWVLVDHVTGAPLVP